MMKSSAYTPIYAQSSDTAVDGSLLEEGLIEAPPAMETLPPVVGQALMEVTAPATLPEGYEFSVSLGPLHNNRPYTIRVPPGGIEKGQKFTFPAPLAPPSAVRVRAPTVPAATYGTSTTQTLPIPVGNFRDGLFDLFKYGACHAHCWTSCFCPLLAAGQVINRLQFTWLGRPAQSAAESARAFTIILYITIFHWALLVMLDIIVRTIDPNDYTKPEPITGFIPPTGFELSYLVIYDIFKYLYAGIILFLLIVLRKSVRAKYGIRASECEDICATLWCPCLVAGQLLRHTTDYDLYPGQLCSATGVSGCPHLLV